MFRVSVMATVTHSKDTVTTRQASATAPTTPRDRTVIPVFLATTVTLGMQIFNMHFNLFSFFRAQLVNKKFIVATYYFDRNNGTCYRQCQGRSVLLSPTSSSTVPLSSSLGWQSGAEGKGGLSHCLWVLSVNENLRPCTSRQLCPPIALTLLPDSHTHCKVGTKFDSVLPTK